MRRRKQQRSHRQRRTPVVAHAVGASCPHRGRRVSPAPPGHSDVGGQGSSLNRWAAWSRFLLTSADTDDGLDRSFGWARRIWSSKLDSEGATRLLARRDGSAVSRIHRARLAVHLYSHVTLMIVVLTTAMVLEERAFRAGDMVLYQCPECRGMREMCVRNPKESVFCTSDSRGREHPRREMMVLKVNPR